MKKQNVGFYTVTIRKLKYAYEKILEETTQLILIDGIR